MVILYIILFVFIISAVSFSLYYIYKPNNKYSTTKTITGSQSTTKSVIPQSIIYNFPYFPTNAPQIDEVYDKIYLPNNTYTYTITDTNFTYDFGQINNFTDWNISIYSPTDNYTNPIASYGKSNNDSGQAIDFNDIKIINNTMVRFSSKSALSGFNPKFNLILTISPKL